MPIESSANTKTRTTGIITFIKLICTRNANVDSHCSTAYPVSGKAMIPAITTINKYSFVKLRDGYAQFCYGGLFPA